MPVARALVADIESEAPSASAVGPGQGLTFAAQIELARVEYAYATGDRPAIHDLSLTIRRGESIGVVGLSGSGKSTLVDLLLGLITPTAGHVRVDGRDIRTHLASWQRQIGYVAQSFYLLDDTLRQNIAFGVDAQQIDQARLINASTRDSTLE
jgi:ABC-type multidrug transport system fused ATPase/permease subunit